MIVGNFRLHAVIIVIIIFASHLYNIGCEL